MKVASVVGTRPQFIKAAMVSKAIRVKHREVLIHTGQHYNFNMSKIFFSGLDLPAPDYHLNSGPGLPGLQLGRMLEGLEAVFEREKPDLVLVYGDSRSTLAGALSASRAGIPLAHVEAGLRSHNQSMPEEFNRVITDHLSTFLFCPSLTAVRNLEKEGMTGIIKKSGLLNEKAPPERPAGLKVINVGDVMLDVLLNSGVGPAWSGEQKRKPGDYLLATLHRAENTDKRERLAGLLANLAAAGEKVVFPVHPRTAKKIEEFNMTFFSESPNIKVIKPVGYREMIGLIKNARKVITDSGGIQKEAFFLRVPCITLREETEWVETVERGCNVLVGYDRRLFREALEANFNADWSGFPYGRGDASLLISSLLEEYLG